MIRPFAPLVRRAAILFAGCWLTACTTGSPGPAPELRSLLQFTAYPNATLNNESYWGTGGGPFPSLSWGGAQEWRTIALPSAVTAYYKGLADRNGWGVQPGNQAPDGLVSAMVLSRSRFTATINVSRSPGMTNGGYPMPAPMPNLPACTPAPPGEPNGPKPPCTQASASPSPSPDATPTPEPTPETLYIQVNGQVTPQ